MFLKKYYFRLLNFDLSVFINSSIIIVIYVDDLLIVDVNKKIIDVVKKILVN